METYFISDTHFNHVETIEEFDRPFSTVDEMNKALINRWNSKVGDGDRVIFVGDLAHAQTENELWTWLGRLNGDIVLLDGNHNPVPRSSFSNCSLPLKTDYQLEKDGYEFYCAHKLEWIPDSWPGWSVYGHVHNRYPNEHRFIEPENKWINVSAELVDFTPVSITRLTKWIDSGQTYITRPKERDH